VNRTHSLFIFISAQVVEQPSAVARRRHGFRNRLFELIHYLPRDRGDAYLGFYEGPWRYLHCHELRRAQDRVVGERHVMSMDSEVGRRCVAPVRITACITSLLH